MWTRNEDGDTRGDIVVLKDYDLKLFILVILTLESEKKKVFSTSKEYVQIDGKGSLIKMTPSKTIRSLFVCLFIYQTNVEGTTVSDVECNGNVLSHPGKFTDLGLVSVRPVYVGRQE